MCLKILCVTPWFPNKPNQKEGNFILDSVEALAKEGHKVTVLVTRPWTPRIFGLLHSDWIRPPIEKHLFPNR